MLFNSRNIRRKQIPDTILAYRYFIDQLPIEQAKKCCLVLHTDRINDHGTDLEAVIESRGGKSGGSVSKTTTHLVMKAVGSGSSKEKKAMELGVTIMAVEQLENLLK